MEKDRSAKIIAMVALFIAVVGLSIGFASYTKDLTIRTSAHVQAQESDFSVRFSKASGSIVTGNVNGVGSDMNVTPDTANIGGNRTITGLGGTFKEPGESITYDFYVGNDGQYDAFLKSVTYQDIGGTKSSIKCTAKEQTSQDLVDKACEGFSIEVIHDPEGDTHSFKETTNNITEHKLAIGAYEKIQVKIEYKAGSSRADGDFDVAFGDITMHYSTVDQ